VEQVASARALRGCATPATQLFGGSNGGLPSLPS